MDERDLAEFLGATGVAGEILRLPEHTPTVESAARALGTTVERIAKSVLFLMGEASVPVVVVANGTLRVDYKRVADHLGVSRRRLRLAGAEEVLAITGYPVGAVPPLGYPCPVRTLVEARLLAQPEVYAGGGAIDALMRITPAELVRATQAEVVEVVAAPAAAEG
jgi:prolyl-tRNA editing enzyme YbaK/EbsC (Cys-tRNA(Pro) deacylase)